MYFQVEVILLCGWLLLVVVRRACDLIGEFCFFWAANNSREVGEEHHDYVEGETSRVALRRRSDEAGESIDECWRQYFANPQEWWDNRLGKTNHRSPDFKNKRTRRALWIDSYSTPEWVRSRFTELPK